MQGELPKCLRLPGLTSQPRTGAVGHFQRVKKCCMLARGWQQFQIGYKFHMSSIEELMLCIKQELGSLLPNLSFLHFLKAVVSRKEF